MARLVGIVAPRSLSSAVLKSLGFLVLVNALDFAVRTAAGQPPPVVHTEIALTTAIALPFTVLIMGALFHQRRLQDTLSILATTDMLTGLPNRRDFLARTQAALAGDGAGLLLLLDADHFKRINDQWGHSVGDACLIAIGAHLRGTLRAHDILGRLGGEEFAAFLPDATLDDVGRFGTRLCCPIPVAGDWDGTLSVTLSIGAAAGRSGMSLDRLMAQADAALYRAKAEGRARVEIWSGGDDNVAAA
ncbi:GGDEF domain-containing protein [Rubellimicrobium rubrum]|uniref:diguanylate cyclase n=1 Tax=Rubellimicrobium rubrum TaxID=2585369 RepID=A0A5C4N0S2_9RHOB|nr:GGDEF domain-containing protein [Rubellimicrobium rubrum]TNC49842.1 GGDEF domain-containing protein [Rubellimicrobium rubrum]